MAKKLSIIYGLSLYTEKKSWFVDIIYNLLKNEYMKIYKMGGLCKSINL